MPRPPANQNQTSVLTRFDPKHVYFHCSYSTQFPEFLEDFKQVVPPSARWWYSGKKEWRIERHYWKDVKELLQEYFGDGCV